MKKTLLFTAMAALALGASAQKADLKDVTPKGYDFDQYESGTQFKFQSPLKENKVSYSPDVTIYDQAVMDQEGHFTTLLRRAATENDPESLEKTYAGATVQDFGGHLGKCLVINEAWSPLASAVPFFNGKAAFPGPTSNFVGGASTMGLGFFSDPTTHHHGWTGAAVRVRIVYTILRRARHVNFTKEPEPWGQNLMVGLYALEGNDGNYSPREDGTKGATVTFNGSEYCIWENEGDCQAEMPAVHTPKSGVGVADPFDGAGQKNDLYTQQLQRFQVVEFDTYSVGKDNPIIVCFNFVNSNASIVIKEVKFFEVQNPMDLLDKVGDEYVPNAGSYFFKRHTSYRYYTEKGIKEIEEGYEYTPAGTKENPHKISTAEDMAAISSKLVANTPVYFSLENDIDMSGITDYEPACGSDGATYDKIVMFNGNNHVIKNLTIDGEYNYPSIFGVLMGEVRNLGVENCNIKGNGKSCGILGGYVGHGNYAGETIVDNVYVTGTVDTATADGGYVGGMFGTTGNNVKITNSYARVDVKNIDDLQTAGANAAILICRSGHPLTIENCYAAGSVNAFDNAGGLIGFVKKDTPAPVVKNSAVLAATIEGVPAHAVVNGTLADGSNVLVADDVKVNGKAAADAVAAANVLAAVKGWDAYHSTDVKDGLPILKWQAESGVIGVEIDENTDAAPVYYNLQGVQVAEPSNGLYIVKRGNKVTKEIIR